MEPVDLSGKSALVTGSTSGIGWAIAKSLATVGAAVTINGRREEGVREAVERLQTALPSAVVRGIAADLATEAGADALLAGMAAPDILVNNVGIYSVKTFCEIPDAEWLEMFQTNVMSGMRLCRGFLPKLIARGWGRIVFISSEVALSPPPDMIPYALTKTAQLALSRGLAAVAAGTGVTVNSILVGPTMSENAAEFLSARARQNQISIGAAAAQFLREHRPGSLLGRYATVDEVANTVTFICSPLAAATIGSALRVDGGGLGFLV